jgi:hypothetical protein
MGFVGLFYPWGMILQAMALVHFVRRRPDTFWLWIILIGGGLGALAYIGLEVLPDVNLLRGSFQGFSRRKRIQQLEAIILENTAIGNFEELADLYLEEGKFARARELYDKVISTRTDSLDPFYRRGLAALAMGDAPSALTDLERVVSTDPKYDFYRAMGVLAQVHSLAGQPERAEELFKNATTISTLSETYYHYAAFLTAQQRPAEAREWAQKILAKKPTMPSYLRRRERPWFRKAEALIKRLPRQG